MNVEKGTYSDVALQNALLQNQFLSKQDRAFITRLAEGVTERRITLDYVINTYSKTKTEKMKPLIRTVLRMGTYQLLYMDGVPSFSAVSESVKLAKSHGFERLSGFCNGVLRTIEREKEKIPMPKDPAKLLSVKYSTPLWLCEKLRKDYPDLCEKILSASFEERPTTLRVNIKKTTPDELIKKLEKTGAKAKMGSISDLALYITEYDSLRRLPGFLDGEFAVQDESSIAAVQACAAQAKKVFGEGKEILAWDVCAAPGGKTCALAEQIKKVKVISMDVAEDKLEKIEENAERLGLENLVTVDRHDATKLYDKYLKEGAPDLIICDVPCSGLGVIGHKNDIKYRLTPEGIESLISLQREIFENTAKNLKPGGLIMYSTCTVNPQENGENVQWFLKVHPEFQSVEERSFIQGREDCDGFYYHILKHN